MPRCEQNGRHFADGLFKWIFRNENMICCIKFHLSLFQWYLLLTWTSNYIHYKVWDEIINPLPNFDRTPIDVWKWISISIPHFTGHVAAMETTSMETARALDKDKEHNLRITGICPIWHVIPLSKIYRKFYSAKICLRDFPFLASVYNLHLFYW